MQRQLGMHGGVGVGAAQYAAVFEYRNETPPTKTRDGVWKEPKIKLVTMNTNTTTAEIPYAEMASNEA